MLNTATKTERHHPAAILLLALTMFLSGCKTAPSSDNGIRASEMAHISGPNVTVQPIQPAVNKHELIQQCVEARLASISDDLREAAVSSKEEVLKLYDKCIATGLDPYQATEMILCVFSNGQILKTMTSAQMRDLGRGAIEALSEGRNFNIRDSDVVMLVVTSACLSALVADSEELTQINRFLMFFETALAAVKEGQSMIVNSLLEQAGDSWKPAIGLARAFRSYQKRNKNGRKKTGGRNSFRGRNGGNPERIRLVKRHGNRASGGNRRGRGINAA